MNADEEQVKPNGIYLTIPPRLYQVPLIALSLGCAIGIMRGGRAASLRFLAENAHRPPTTVQGWYFYKKTKNYKVMLGGLKGATKEGGRLGGISLLFVGVEEGMERLGKPYSELGEIWAGTVTGGVFAGIYRTGWKRIMGLGIVMGGILKVAKEVRGRVVDKG